MRAAFLDRDGVLNVDIGYLSRVEQIVWIEGAVGALKALREAGYALFVVTNQSGVARGYYDERAVHVLHDGMQRHLRNSGAWIDEFVYCPHHPDGLDARYAIECPCRKPKPGMLLGLIEKHKILPSESLMIGDKPSDLEAGEAAGVPSYLFSGGALDTFVEELLGAKSTRASE